MFGMLEFVVTKARVEEVGSCSALRTVLPFFKACGWWSHVFAAMPSPRTLIKIRPCDPLPLFMGYGMIPNM